MLVLDAPCGKTIGGKFDGDAGVILEGPEYCYGYNRWLIRWSELPTLTTPTPAPTEIQPKETPQHEETKQNPIQEVVKKIQKNIPSIQTVMEKIQGVIDRIRSLFGF